MTRFCVQVQFGRRRLGMATPVDGPCTPAYLAPDLTTRFIWVEADTAMDAELLAFDIAETLMVSGNELLKRFTPAPGAITAMGDMVTSLTTIDWIEDEVAA